MERFLVPFTLFLSVIILFMLLPLTIKPGNCHSDCTDLISLFFIQLLKGGGLFE